jgi:hypothetical protein
MLVDADVDIIFFDERFNNVEVLNSFGGDAVEAHCFGELKNFTPLLGSLAIDDAIVNGADMVLLKLGLELGNVGAGKIVVGLNLGLIRAELLAWIKFDALTAGLSSFFNGFKGRETIEGVSLATNGKATRLATIGYAVFAAACDCGESANHQKANKNIPHARRYGIRDKRAMIFDFNRHGRLRGFLQVHIKPAALTEFRFNSHLSTHSLDRPPHDCQSDSRSRIAGRV